MFLFLVLYILVFWWIAVTVLWAACGGFSVRDLSTFKKIAVTSAPDCSLYKATHQVNAVYPNWYPIHYLLVNFPWNCEFVSQLKPSVWVSKQWLPLPPCLYLFPPDLFANCFQAKEVNTTWQSRVLLAPVAGRSKRNLPVPSNAAVSGRIPRRKPPAPKPPHLPLRRRWCCSWSSCWCYLLGKPRCLASSPVWHPHPVHLRCSTVKLWGLDRAHGHRSHRSPNGRRGAARGPSATAPLGRRRCRREAGDSGAADEVWKWSKRKKCRGARFHQEIMIRWCYKEQNICTRQVWRPMTMIWQGFSYRASMIRGFKMWGKWHWLSREFPRNLGGIFWYLGFQWFFIHLGGLCATEEFNPKVLKVNDMTRRKAYYNNSNIPPWSTYYILFSHPMNYWISK